MLTFPEFTELLKTYGCTTVNAPQVDTWYAYGPASGGKAKPVIPFSPAFAATAAERFGSEVDFVEAVAKALLSGHTGPIKMSKLLGKLNDAVSSAAPTLPDQYVPVVTAEDASDESDSFLTIGEDQYAALLDYFDKITHPHADAVFEPTTFCDTGWKAHVKPVPPSIDPPLPPGQYKRYFQDRTYEITVKPFPEWVSSFIVRVVERMGDTVTGSTTLSAPKKPGEYPVASVLIPLPGGGDKTFTVGGPKQSVGGYIDGDYVDPKIAKKYGKKMLGFGYTEPPAYIPPYQHVAPETHVASVLANKAVPAPLGFGDGDPDVKTPKSVPKLVEKGEAPSGPGSGVKGKIWIAPFIDENGEIIHKGVWLPRDEWKKLKAELAAAGKKLIEKVDYEWGGSYSLVVPIEPKVTDKAPAAPKFVTMGVDHASGSSMHVVRIDPDGTKTVLAACVGVMEAATLSQAGFVLLVEHFAAFGCDVVGDKLVPGSDVKQWGGPYDPKALPFPPGSYNYKTADGHTYTLRIDSEIDTFLTDGEPQVRLRKRWTHGGPPPVAYMVDYTGKKVAVPPPAPTLPVTQNGKTYPKSAWGDGVKTYNASGQPKFFFSHPDPLDDADKFFGMVPDHLKNHFGKGGGK